MPRGPKPAKSKEAKPPSARKSPKNEDSRVRDLEQRLAEALRDKAEASKREAEAQEQQAATAEILRVISSSPSDLQPVMQTIVDSAVRLADADNAMIGRAEGDHIRWLAVAGTLSPERPHVSHQPINRSLPSGRAIIDRQTTQVEDISVSTRLRAKTRPSFGSYSTARLITYLTLRTPRSENSRVVWPGRADIEVGSWCHCAEVQQLSVASLSRASRLGGFRRTRLHSSKPLPTKRSSPSRMCDCSPSCRRRISR